MSNDRSPSRSKARWRPMLWAVFALGLASQVQGAHAQTPSDKPPAAAGQPAAAPTPGGGAKPSSVEGVTVEAPRVRSDVGATDPDKKAALDAEAAQDEAWRQYRKSTPPLTRNTNDMSKDFPGLQTYVPQ